MNQNFDNKQAFEKKQKCVQSCTAWRIMEDLVSICFLSVIVIKTEHLKMDYWKAMNKRAIAIASEKVQMLQGLFKSCLSSLANLPSRIMKALF